jgi:hypothetical protein
MQTALEGNARSSINRCRNYINRGFTFRHTSKTLREVLYSRLPTLYWWPPSWRKKAGNTSRGATRFRHFQCWSHQDTNVRNKYGCGVISTDSLLPSSGEREREREKKNENDALETGRPVIFLGSVSECVIKVKALAAWRNECKCARAAVRGVWRGRSFDSSDWVAVQLAAHWEDSCIRPASWRHPVGTSDGQSTCFSFLFPLFLFLFPYFSFFPFPTFRRWFLALLLIFPFPPILSFLTILFKWNTVHL